MTKMCNKRSVFEQWSAPVSDAPSGPLLYHFENMANELSVELSYEDIRTAVATTGFHIEVAQTCRDVPRTVCSRENVHLC